MSNEQMAELIQGGRREYILQLWIQVRRFALKTARRWAYSGRGGVTVDDLMQEAFLALLDALEGWRPEGGAFLTWYALRLKAAFTEATGRRTQRQKLDPLHSAASLDAPLTDDEGDQLVMVDVIPDPAAEAALEAVDELDEWEHLRDMLETALLTLTELQRYVVRARYWNGQTLTQAAAERGISYETARKEEALALRALRKPTVLRPLKEFLHG